MAAAFFFAGAFLAAFFAGAFFAAVLTGFFGDWLRSGWFCNRLCYFLTLDCIVELVDEGLNSAWKLNLTLVDQAKCLFAEFLEQSNAFLSGLVQVRFEFVA